MRTDRFISAFLSLLLITGLAAGQRAIPTVPEVERDKVICFALYTVHNNILKLTAQLYPLKEGESRKVSLEVKKDGEWVQVAEADVIEEGWTALLRVENWDASKDVQYRVKHAPKASYEGIIKRDPIDKNIITVFGFTGNSIHPIHGGDIPKQDIVDNINKMDPDLLFFSGDQVYDHDRHYAAWLKFGRDFGDAIRNRPTITIPDDHDVGQANLWGASGKKSNTGDGHDGGYYKPVEYVKEVERAQTSHLPDPYDPTPVERGIGVYYTAFNLGGISFAIIEDRKFKSGPEGLVPRMGPRPDHITDPDYDPKTVDVPGAVLLGERQLKFLEEWGQDWKGSEMKCVLSQTIFCGGAHIHGKTGGRLHADMDSNGWPQTGRNRAIDAIRKCFAVHFAGDQHLGTIFHHGIDEFRDGMYSFCVPSIANLYLRWWEPLKPGANREPGAPEYTGDHFDGFGNRVTCFAAANPSSEPDGGGALTTRAAGFGIMKFNKKTRQITMECWPRNVDITDPDAKQYPGWPRTIKQEDNYGRKPVAYLPALLIEGEEDPVVQVVDAEGKIVYTLRVNGKEFSPKVFKEGKYTIKVGEGSKQKILKDVESAGSESSDFIKVKL